MPLRMIEDNLVIVKSSLENSDMCKILLGGHFGYLTSQKREGTLS